MSISKFFARTSGAITTPVANLTLPQYVIGVFAAGTSGWYFGKNSSHRANRIPSETWEQMSTRVAGEIAVEQLKNGTDPTTSVCRDMKDPSKDAVSVCEMHAAFRAFVKRK